MNSEVINGIQKDCKKTPKIAWPFKNFERKMFKFWSNVNIHYEKGFLTEKCPNCFWFFGLHTDTSTWYVHMFTNFWLNDYKTLIKKLVINLHKTFFTTLSIQKGFCWISNYVIKVIISVKFSDAWNINDRCEKWDRTTR